MTAVEEFIEHYGKKGMKWGVRNEQQSTGFRGQGSGPSIDPALHASTQLAAKEVASLIGERYGFQITQVRNLKTDNPAEYHYGTVAYVQHTPGKKEGVIFTKPEDFRKELKDAEKVGWMVPGTANPRGMLTHESAHAMFHADQQTKRGIVSNKVVGDHQQARDKALAAADKQSRLDGIHPDAVFSKVSGYAAASGTREEVEAEMFSQYHWGNNPPKFIQAWGETLHREMGIDPTPFREVVKNG